MADNVAVSLLTLPAELIYRILDEIDILTIEISVRNVCTQLRVITDKYRQYQVIFNFIIDSIIRVLVVGASSDRRHSIH
jgi:hypothetical protein